MKTWLLLFLFNGLPYASGPHDLDTCLEMAKGKPGAACVNKDRPYERRKTESAPK